MLPLEAVLTALANALLALFLWRFVPHAARYPFLLAYLTPYSVRAFIGGYRYWSGTPHTELYSYFYWIATGVLTILRLFVAWEALRQAVPRDHALSAVVRAATVMVLFGLCVTFLLMGPEGDIFDDVERKVSLTSGVWVALVLTFTTFYGIRLSREVFALALGLGVFAAISLVNTSALALVRDFAPVWVPVRQSSASLVMAIWLWGFWNPPQNQQPPDTQPAGPARSTWERRWSEVRQSVRSLSGRSE